MKVLSYLELKIHFERIIQTEYKKWRAWLRTLFGEYHTLEEVYSQPFKPELIVELFEGWVTDATDESEHPYANYWYDRNYAVSPSISAEFGEYFDDNLYLLNQELILCKPRTLDDFINDCKRTGIELEWKV